MTTDTFTPLCGEDHFRPYFDAVIDLSDTTKAGRISRPVIQAARNICGMCDHRQTCLEDFGDADGIVAGFTLDERVTLGYATRATA